MCQHIVYLATKCLLGITSIWLSEESAKTYNLVRLILDVAEKDSVGYKSCIVASSRKSEVVILITGSSNFMRLKENSVETTTAEPKC
jgi:hypothetical protein